MFRKKIDFHIHLDFLKPKFPTLEMAASEAQKQIVESGFESGLVLHLRTQPWSLLDVSQALKKCSSLFAFANIDAHAVDAEEQLRWAIRDLGYKGLKLHPRLEQYPADHPNVCKLFQAAGKLGVPVLVDAFPDGVSLQSDFHPKQYAKLALSSPDTPLIVAHFGGIYALEFLLLAKRIPNLYFNIAYTLLYFRESHVTQDLVYCIKSLKGDRVFYGSDYPDRSIAKSLDATLEVFKNFNLNEELQEKVLYGNAKQFMENYF